MEIIQTVVNINSAEPERLRGFYRDVVGLKEYPEMEEGAMIVAQTPFVIDGHDALTSATTREPARTLWNFAVDDLAAEQARLQKAGVRFITTGPVPKDGQISFSTFTDPDGNYAQIFHGDGMPAGMELFVLMRHSGDPERLRAFYRDIVGISDDHPEMGNPFIMGTTWMYVGPHSEVHGPALEPARLLVNFVVADVATEQKRLEGLGVSFSRSMGREPWGGIISTFADPDGNYLQMVEFRPE